MTSDMVPAFTVKQIVVYPSMAQYMARRWVGGLVDILSIMLVFFISSTLLSFLWVFIAQAVLRNDDYLKSPTAAAAMLWISGIITVLYFPVLEGVWGRSFGKLITGTIVVDEDGKPPGIWKAILRTITRFFEVNPVGAGCLPAAITVILSRNRQRLGDMLAGTYVVRVKDLALLSRNKVFTQPT